MRQRRLPAADLFSHGATQAEVARTLGVSHQAALVWYRRWQPGGAEALHGAGRAGRRPRLSTDQLDQVEQALLAGARAHGYDTDLWTLARVAQVIQQQAGITHHAGTSGACCASWAEPRSVPPAAERNDEQIARWVAEDWP